MVVTLVSPFQSITSVGIRSLSAYLRRAGYQTRVVFLPMPGNTGWYDAYETDRYSDQVVQDMLELCAQSDLIGFTLMTQNLFPVANLTLALRKLGIPIAWGGIHPTACPEEALEYADMVCLGEGEESLLEVVQRKANGQDYYDVRNFWFKRDGQMVKNPVRPPIADLNSLPFVDYDISNHFVLDDNAVVPMTEKLLKKYLALDLGPLKDKIVYRTMVTRGCPHNCTYCCNNVLRLTYGRQTFLRKRSPEHVIQELVNIKAQMSFVGTIYFVDDTLFVLSESETKRFAELYKAQVGLPFAAFCSPGTVSEKKLEYLVEAGLVRIGMGIQSGSERTLQIYQRHVRKEQVLKAAQIIHKFQDRIQPPRYDIITDNPWETLDDRLDTLDLLQQLPRPFRVVSFSLTFYPGTQLYEKAREQHLIQDEREQVLKKNYWFTSGSYYNLLQYCYSLGFPTWLMNILTNRRIVIWLSHPWFNPVYRFVAHIRDKVRRQILVGLFRKLQRS